MIFLITRKLFVKSIPELQLRYKAIEKYGLWKFVTSNDRPSLAMSILSKYYPEIDYPEDKTIPLLQVKDVLFDYIKFEDPINQKWLNNLKEEYLSNDFKSYITIDFNENKAFDDSNDKESNKRNDKQDAKNLGN